MNPRAFQPAQVRARLWRALGVGALAAAALWSGGCASYSASDNVELFVSRAPLPTLVPRAQVAGMAERVAARREGDFVLFGAGRSMEPVYLAGTAVVVHPTAFHMLRKGMPVVYRNRGGACVAHMLVEKTPQGWRAIGLNNAKTDEAFVTSKNLIGIIQHAFAADDGVYRPDIAAQIALKRALEGGSAVALVH